MMVFGLAINVLMVQDVETGFFHGGIHRRRGRMDRYHVDAQDWYPDSMCGQFVLFDDALKAIAAARAEALREAAERAIAWSHEPYPEDTDLTPQGISRYLDEGLRSAILADKQEDK
jgi:hypothetical protein